MAPRQVPIGSVNMRPQGDTRIKVQDLGLRFKAQGPRAVEFMIFGAWGIGV